MISSSQKPAWSQENSSYSITYYVPEHCQRANKIRDSFFQTQQGQDLVQRVFIYLEIFLKNLFLSFLLHIASFSSKVGCEHEKVNFECEPYSRLVIYSASYGRTQYQSVQCPQPQGVAEESKFLLDILKKLKKWHLA